MNDDAQRNGHMSGHIDDLLADYIANETTAAERSQIARHLAECAPCRQALNEARHIRELLGTLRDEFTSSQRKSSLANEVMARLGLPANQIVAEQNEGEIARLDQFEEGRPVHDTNGVMGMSSNSTNDARGADHPSRSPQGAISSMQAPTTDKPVTTMLQSRPQPAPLVAFTAVMLIALLAVGIFISRVPSTPRAVSQLGITPGASATISASGNGAPEVTPAPGTQTPIQPDIKSYSLIVAQPGTARVLPKNPTSIFTLGQNMYIVMTLNNKVKAGDKVSAKWFFNNQDVTPLLLIAKADCCSVRVRKTGETMQVVFKFLDLEQVAMR